jgi:hypothetical protein
MADITNQQAVRFCNEKARAFADSLETTYETARKYKAEWDANSLGTVLTDTADVVVDGAASDGRKVLTGAKAQALYTAASQMITWFETGTPSRIERVRQVSVNGQAKF